ncbi:hypothetical protein [Pseudotenacibaculum haliotis]|uniref:hypothetical protein n=1 Tax=Pseudotenacibaculum haliotis TaxID=1862138 RepID=UPI0036D2261C
MNKGNVKNKYANAISQEEALRKVRDYAKYAVLTAIGIYLIWHLISIQAMSPSTNSVPPPPSGFRW